MGDSSPARTSTTPATILLSGGHLTPALATIEYFQSHHPDVKLLFVGREYSQERERQVSQEREACEKLHVPFFSIRAAKFHRTNWWRNIGELPRLLPSLYQSWFLIRENNVDVFLSFGGYLAVPLALAAKLLGRKIVTHEQTKTSGLANELIATLADRVAISFEESRKHFPKHKTVVTGNPLRPSILHITKERPSWLPKSSKPLLYITGGSQGSQVINQSVESILPELTAEFLVVHQCGHSEHHHYLSALESARELLPSEQQASYVIREWVEEKDVSWLFHHAALVLSRSGANTTLEIALHAAPAIFVPLPFSHNNEQLKNAETLVDAGAALLLEQKDLDGESLWETIQNASAQRTELKRQAEKRRNEIPTDGAQRLAELCLSLLRSEGWSPLVQRFFAAVKHRLIRTK